MYFILTGFFHFDFYQFFTYCPGFAQDMEEMKLKTKNLENVHFCIFLAEEMKEKHLFDLLLFVC